MLDQYKRTIDYLRISVTDRCNLRCRYCMPEGGIKHYDKNEVLSFEEIVQFAKTAVEGGVEKIRLTGGEPLLRENIVQLVAMLRKIDDLEELCMTTNGMLLEKYALQLKDAGLNRINVSLDTLDPHKYKEITGGGNLEQVLRGIKAAKEAGLTPIKINCVVESNTPETNVEEVRTFAQENNFATCFIRQMDIAEGTFWPTEGSSGGHCEKCNRLRLTSNGILRPCLLGNLGYNIRELGNQQAITSALTNKPLKGERNTLDPFCAIGG